MCSAGQEIDLFNLIIKIFLLWLDFYWSRFLLVLNMSIKFQGLFNSTVKRTNDHNQDVLSRSCEVKARKSLA